MALKPKPPGGPVCASTVSAGGQPPSTARRPGGASVGPGRGSKSLGMAQKPRGRASVGEISNPKPPLGIPRGHPRPQNAGPAGGILSPSEGVSEPPFSPKNRQKSAKLNEIHEKTGKSTKSPKKSENPEKRASRAGGYNQGTGQTKNSSIPRGRQCTKFMTP